MLCISYKIVGQSFHKYFIDKFTIRLLNDAILKRLITDYCHHAATGLVLKVAATRQ